MSAPNASPPIGTSHDEAHNVRLSLRETTMPSKYDKLDAVSGLEQTATADLKRALEPRGCVVTHHGTSASHAPGGRSDIHVADPHNRRLILVEVTKRKGAAADGEFIAVTDHLEKAVAAGGYDDYCCLFVSPGTSARMSANIRNLYNTARERGGKPGRVIAVDFPGLEMLVKTLSEATPTLFPASGFGTLFQHWDRAVDDVRTRQLIAQDVLGADPVLVAAITEEMRKRDAEREQRLKKAIENLENKLREHGITGSSANATLIYLTFLRLYEEKREADSKGKHRNRFTGSGFVEWAGDLATQLKTANKGRLVEVLLREVAEDKDLIEAGLLQVSNGQKDRLHKNVTDALVKKLILPVFDEYEFYGSSVDVLGVVFETLARRGEKDTRVGQFFTPQEVVNFCADLAQLGPRDVVLDPAVGTARFLIAAMDRMLLRSEEVPGIAAEKIAKAIRTKQLLGVDLDEWVATIAKMNMYIHGDGKSNIVNANGLILGTRRVFSKSYGQGVAGQIDVVLTNPPLGNTSFTVAAQHWADRGATTPTEADRIEFLRSLGTVPLRTPITKESKKLDSTLKALSKRTGALEELIAAHADARKIEKARAVRDGLLEKLKEAKAAELTATANVVQVPEGEKLKGGALFIGAIASYLKATRHPDAGPEWQGGRAVLVVDEAILNTANYDEVRSFIRRKFFIKAVVSLGRDAFKYLAHTDAKTSILFLVRKPNDDLLQREPIFFAHAEKVGYGATGKWVGNDLPAVQKELMSVLDTIKSCYVGAAFDEARCREQVSALPGHRDQWHARFDAGTQGDRLDFHFARYRDLADVLWSSGREVVTLGELIEPRIPLDRPPLSSTGEYEFAVVKRVGIVAPKGVAAVQFAPDDLWLVEEGDIAISGIDLNWGAAGVARADVHGLVMSKEMFAYRVKDGVDVLPEYVAIMLRTPPVRDMILGRVSGTSNRLRITDAEQLLGVPVLAPPDRAEQERIVDVANEAAEFRRLADVKLAQAAQMIAKDWPK